MPNERQIPTSCASKNLLLSLAAFLVGGFFVLIGWVIPTVVCGLVGCVFALFTLCNVLDIQEYKMRQLQQLVNMLAKLKLRLDDANSGDRGGCDVI